MLMGILIVSLLLQGHLLKYHCLDNPENYRKLLVVDLDQPVWATSDLTVRTMEHWQAVAVGILSYLCVASTCYMPSYQICRRVTSCLLV